MGLLDRVQHRIRRFITDRMNVQLVLRIGELKNEPVQLILREQRIPTISWRIMIIVNPVCRARFDNAVIENFQRI